MIQIKPMPKGFKFDFSNLQLNQALSIEHTLKQNDFYFRKDEFGRASNENRLRNCLEDSILYEPYRELSFEHYQLKDVPIVKYLLQRELIPADNVEALEPMYQKRRKQHMKDLLSIEDFMKTEDFLKARTRVETLFGGRTFSDGSHLFDYQMDCAALIVSKKRVLEALDTGLGKTRTTVVGLVSDPKNKKILIVTMSRNISDWQREIKLLGLEHELQILETPADMKSTKRIHIVTYEKWKREMVKEQTDEQGQSKLVYRKKALFKYFDRSYDAAAIDEGHLIKNGSTICCKSIMAIKTKTRVLLSGTPAENGASDLFWLLGWLIGDKMNFFDFNNRDRFSAYGGVGEKNFKVCYGGINKVTIMDSDRINERINNNEKLWALLDTVMFRKLKTDDDVSGDIQVPEPYHRRIHLEMTDDEKTLYAKRLQEFQTWFSEMENRRKIAERSGGPIPNEMIYICSWLDKLRRVASAPWLQPDYVGKQQPSKLEFVRNKVQECAHRKEKMLIFTSQKQTAEELGTLLNEYAPNYQAGYIHGSVPMAHRHHLMNRFQDPNDSMSILVMTMRTGAESYTLTQAKKVIFMDLDYNAKKIEQCYSRAVRLGQKDVVEVNWLISVDTIDANIHSLILSKKTGVDLAIDRKELDFEQFAREFEGDVSTASVVDFEEFAREMLSRGTKRKDYENASA